MVPAILHPSQKDGRKTLNEQHFGVFISSSLVFNFRVIISNLHDDACIVCFVKIIFVLSSYLFCLFTVFHPPGSSVNSDIFERGDQNFVMLGPKGYMDQN